MKYIFFVICRKPHTKIIFVNNFETTAPLSVDFRLKTVVGKGVYSVHCTVPIKLMGGVRSENWSTENNMSPNDSIVLVGNECVMNVNEYVPNRILVLT